MYMHTSLCELDVLYTVLSERAIEEKKGTAEVIIC